MTALEILTAAQKLDVRLRLVRDRLRVDAPEGALTPELRDAIRNRKPELLGLIGQRQAAVGRRISGAFDHLNAAGGPWPAELFAKAKPLALAMDREALAFIRGEASDLAPFEAALARWEGALSVWRSPPLEHEQRPSLVGSSARSCPCGSFVYLDMDDGARICGRCRKQLGCPAER